MRAIEATLYELVGEILDGLAATMRECEQPRKSAATSFLVDLISHTNTLLRLASTSSNESKFTGSERRTTSKVFP